MFVALKKAVYKCKVSSFILCKLISYYYKYYSLAHAWRHSIFFYTQTHSLTHTHCTLIFLGGKKKREKKKKTNYVQLILDNSLHHVAFTIYYSLPHDMLKYLLWCLTIVISKRNK